MMVVVKLFLLVFTTSSNHWLLWRTVQLCLINFGYFELFLFQTKNMQILWMDDNKRARDCKDLKIIFPSLLISNVKSRPYNICIPQLVTVFIMIVIIDTIPHNIDIIICIDSSASICFIWMAKGKISLTCGHCTY